MTVTQADLEWWLKLAPTLEWTFAKTMADIPHSYVVRGKALGDEDFIRAVKVIRTFGEPGKFYSRLNVYLTHGEQKWWTMGAPLEDTIIINTASTDQVYGDQDAPHTASGIFSVYDELATEYDSRYTDEACQAENNAIKTIIREHFGAFAPNTLDVGCGTGLLLDMGVVSSKLYTGVDPSQGMLNELIRKHPLVTDLRPATMEDALPEFEPRSYDLVVSLFGSPSYIDPMTLVSLVPLSRDMVIFMHYIEGYWPDYEDQPAESDLSRKAALAIENLVETKPRKVNRFQLNKFLVTVIHV